MCERVDEYQGRIQDLSEGVARCVKGWMNIEYVKCKNETLAERSERMNVEIL